MKQERDQVSSGGFARRQTRPLDRAAQFRESGTFVTYWISVNLFYGSSKYTWMLLTLGLRLEMLRSLKRSLRFSKITWKSEKRKCGRKKWARKFIFLYLKPYIHT